MERVSVAAGSQRKEGGEGKALWLNRLEITLAGELSNSERRAARTGAERRESALKIEPETAMEGENEEGMRSQ